MRNVLTVLIFALLAPIAAAEKVSVPGLQGLDETRYHLVDYKAAERQLHVFVGLPDGYATSGRDYPTLYILDGGLLYPQLLGYYMYLRLGEEVPEMLIVALSYGTSDWRAGNERARDYTAPAEDREFWGGAEAFQDFLGEALLPFIEAEYRSDADQRIIFGQSLGGQFVLYSAQTRPELFWGRIASNPALHRNLPLFLEMRPADDNSESRLFVSSGTDDDPLFREPALAWRLHWRQQDDMPWEMLFADLEGHSHFSAAPAALRQGLKWLFNE